MNCEVRCTLVFSVAAHFVMFGMSLVSQIPPLYALRFDVFQFIVGALIFGFGIARLLLDAPTEVMVDRFGMKRFMTYGPSQRKRSEPRRKAHQRREGRNGLIQESASMSGWFPLPRPAS